MRVVEKMLLRRRAGRTDTLTYLLASACALIVFLVCSILYGTRSDNPSLPTLVKEVLPAGRCLCQYSTVFTCDTCLDCAASQSAFYENATNHNIGSEEERWVFQYSRDSHNYGLDEDQCHVAFPGLFEDIERAKNQRTVLGKVTERLLSSFNLSKGMVRAMIYNGELYVLQTYLVDNVNRQKALAVLASLHRAITSAPVQAPIENVEFVFSVEDLPAQPNKPIWTLARRAQDTSLWLIPDFGFWSWDMPDLGTFSEVADEARQRETVEPWDSKRERLVWRGKISFAPKLRRALLDAARGKSWSDVGQVAWSTPNYKDQFLGPVDQCGYMFIAHAEGRSYSGALKYRQLCRSVIVSHKLQWIQHHHYLMRATGPLQNYVEVERDFSDLNNVMQDLLAHPEKAKRIADNSVQTFRERYLTPAAEACYWRELVKKWKEVSFDPVLYDGVEIGDGRLKRTQKRGVRYETFMLYEYPKQMEYPKSAEMSPAIGP
ncbi:hypothetical protein BU24DRAFT_33136 [Aaosphaeria arxii CBS 175.79]|uniref:Glycosyl transferase CAP10 domain-containing protein n=1 Tax=Aaosphaeria arxii CBS 175.79 TaxID=1450172 RepID=A0A6A5YB66_9PLEO|nr:uncharacterized protein BU24DRAFT_33136 [Aaosphaeria arxii CBS 175.79]KAF2021941.1 hypothetical protein BU24DRAFT_33136 [Aaosphaeria arxii CBS 175.79]